jgi:uncharacterized membrane protein YkoI
MPHQNISRTIGGFPEILRAIAGDSNTTQPVNRAFISGSVLSLQIKHWIKLADAPRGAERRSGSIESVSQKRRESMKRAKIFAAVIYGVLVMGTIAFVHFPELQAEEMRAKIGAAQAREMALRAVPGTVKHEELETEHGRLIYSFEIRPSGQRGAIDEKEPVRKRGIVEVNVSAMDGSIVEVHREHAGKRNNAKQFARMNAEPASSKALL